MMSGDLQKSTENAEPNSEFSVGVLHTEFLEKTTVIAYISPIRQLNQGISEGFGELNCPQAFIANLFKTVTVSLPWRILGTRQREK